MAHLPPEENRVLKEQLGGRRLRLTDNQRRRLAAKGKILGRRVLARIATVVTPDTILRWHRTLVAKKWEYSDRRRKVGRPPVSPEIVELVLRMARNNPTTAYPVDSAKPKIWGAPYQADYHMQRSAEPAG